VRIGVELLDLDDDTRSMRRGEIVVWPDSVLGPGCTNAAKLEVGLSAELPEESLG
jgi:hypothetical protein